MCNLQDAQNHLRLANILSKKDISRAHLHYLEASSIYTLLSNNIQDVREQRRLHQAANRCYYQAHALYGRGPSQLTMSELARRTLHELEILNPLKSKHFKGHHQESSTISYD